MNKDSRDYLEMSFRSIDCFTNDGKLLPDELQSIVDIALRDGIVDANEKRVLSSIISKLTPSELTPAMQAKVAEVKKLL
ncbi:MAG: hypothetical protein H6R18_2230 [Proteobacteria bacterium]|nr:hypothetical protein [Pseudomonadota bacterium]